MNPSIAIILVETENPDNIGAAARAMKNMGLRDLRLVRPPAQWKKKGKKLAMSAYDVLKAARVFKKLPEAVSDRHFVIATSRRGGKKRGRFLGFEETLQRIHQTVHAGKKAAIVFGKESKGLSNQDLLFCDWVTTFPVHPDYPSLNLAQAVMVTAFSLFVRNGEGTKTQEIPLISKTEMEIALEAFNRGVDALGYKSEVACRVHKTFRSLVKRSGLLPSEAQMLKGLSRRIRERAVVKKTLSR
ncbi:MAG: TrmJ/YjtD family RNA methyltransferase [Candidatus Omnitrophica bacterium]|nr:TrmJ/YjtD family RNA methyltransferase [Candidatus Omnitrophota bacterium]